MALILIVEDAWFTRRLISKTLQAAGHTTVEASCGREGLEKALTHAPDCILLDLLMPDLDGREVLQKLRDQESRMPAIVLTADIQSSSRQQCLELGAIAVLGKPPNPQELAAAIDQAIAAKVGGITP
ncbi:MULTISPECIES: response regulator transcription factor [Trichocoleus]|uniref:Response regulator n=1 Tax=Trichocoleus desertorum GB2-A4 TaxID=2933944 RepID=A0ABV0J9G0_9CYAN|nr:response regulator [Trichocoleus sp. FACHB-46]MBD1862094.1 response regulator [Trichocoleus sp. FACHB-46]